MATATKSAPDKNAAFKAGLRKRAAAPKPAVTKAVQPIRGGNVPHLIVKAGAGSGKTFTLIEGVTQVQGRRTPGVVGSEQQEAVWEAMRKGGSVRSAAIVAFNKPIAEELARRVPQGCQAMTMHSMGFAAVRKGMTHRPDVEGYKVSKLIEELTGKDWRELKKSSRDSTYLAAISRLADLCRMNLTGWTAKDGFHAEDITEQELDQLCAHYDVQCNGEKDRVYGDLWKLLEMIRTTSGIIDFGDMIWLPIVNQYPIWRNEMLLVDEAQDLNRCQQELATFAGDRLVLCGDPRQAIYGFAGADTDSMPRMQTRLEATPRGCVMLPLTVTRRCGKAIVAVAREIVEDFEAHESNCEGQVLYWNEEQMSKEAGIGDMILCRVNAPLVSHAFRFLKEGRKANIQGRDIGEGLIRLVKKLAGDNDDVGELMSQVDTWYDLEAQKLAKRKWADEAQQIALRDKKECLEAFCDGAKSVADILATIAKLFDTMGRGDNTKGCILLSSIHRAKGLEAPRVFILLPELLPHPMARSAWQQGQESNLKYVAVTRAIDTLVYTAGAKKEVKVVELGNREEE